jgi:hypothetical protein
MRVAGINLEQLVDIIANAGGESEKKEGGCRTKEPTYYLASFSKKRCVWSVERGFMSDDRVQNA